MYGRNCFFWAILNPNITVAKELGLFLHKKDQSLAFATDAEGDTAIVFYLQTVLDPKLDIVKFLQ